MTAKKSTKVLLSGWFSFENMGATAGDIIACDLITKKLLDAGLAYDIAYAPSFEKGISWEKTRAAEYSHVIFICGPFGNGWPVNDFLDHFAGSKMIGINLSMLQPLDQWNPFDLLYERDSDQNKLPDLALLSERPKVPVVGLILSHVQKEYGARAKQEDVHSALEKALSRREMSLVRIDTHIIGNQYKLRSAAEIESLIAKMDFVITTRLHGMVLALKNEVPAIAIDPIEGGAKISRQAAILEWPLVIKTHEFSVHQLSKAVDFAMTREAKTLARQAKKRGQKILFQRYDHFIEDLKNL
jgi:hypothetical protein